MAFMIGTHSVPVVAEMLGRTTNAVVRQIQASELGLKRRAIAAYGMSVPEVARALGVADSTADRWVRSGKLISHRVKLVHGSIRAVDSEDLMAWLESGYALATNLDPAGDWVDVVSEARQQLATRYISGMAIVALLRVGCNFIATKTPGRKPFPKPFITLGTWAGGCYYERQSVRDWLDEHPQYWTKQARASL
jgi:excisionase family DNA binding protein